MSISTRTCRNCGHRVLGQYCGHCGQQEGKEDTSFFSLAGEFASDLVNFDSRLWRTLSALVFRPGQLTGDFIDGRRARYLPPVRLYLVISFATFLVLSLSPLQRVSTPEEGADEAILEVETEQAASDGEEQSERDDEISLADEDDPQWLKEIDQHLQGNLEKLQADPRKFVETLFGYLPQMMFLLLPVFALLLQLLYLLQPFHYLQHLVFSLHYHCFVYLLFLAAELVEFASININWLLSLVLGIYLPLALRRCYGSGWPGAVAKSLLLYVSYTAALLVGFAAVAVLTLAQL